MTPEESKRSVSSPEFEAAINGALERRPEFVIPEGFAARVAATAAAQSPVRRRSSELRTSELREGRTSVADAIGYVAIAAIAIVLAVLTFLHPETFGSGRGVLFDLEVLLLVQLMAVVLWLGRSRLSY